MCGAGTKIDSKIISFSKVRLTTYVYGSDGNEDQTKRHNSVNPTMDWGIGKFDFSFFKDQILSTYCENSLEYR